MKSYSEKLRDPRWQRKRLDILKRSDFTCEECGAKDKTLHVHHGFYVQGLEPWQYPPEFLHSLCEDCHSDSQNITRLLHGMVGLMSQDEMGSLLKSGLEILPRQKALSVIELWKCIQGDDER